MGNGKNDDEAHNSWTKKVQDFIPFSFFPLVQLCLTFHYSTSESNWCFPKKKVRLWYFSGNLQHYEQKSDCELWKHAKSLQNAWTWVHLHVVSGPRTVQIPLFKAKLAEQLKKFAHPTTGSQQQPQVRCSLKLGRKNVCPFRYCATVFWGDSGQTVYPTIYIQTTISYKIRFLFKSLTLLTSYTNQIQY